MPWNCVKNVRMGDMCRYNKIAKYLFGNRLQNEGFKKINQSFGLKSLFTLDEFEKKVNAASLASRNIRITNRKFNIALSNRSLDLKASAVFFQREAYIYLFFCAVNRIYEELRFLDDYSEHKYNSEIEIIREKLKSLANQRDGLEHGLTEDAWALNMGHKSNLQSDEQLARKRMIGDNFDFDRNMLLIDEAYDFVLNKLSL